MIVFYIGIILLCLYGLKISHKGFFDDFLGVDQSNAIKGIFILTVFIRHSLQYILRSGYTFSTFPDTLFFKIDHELEQLIVVMFLFYSGFGVMESIIKRKMEYIHTMPKKRILSTLLNFDVAICFFFVLNIIIGKEMTASEIGLSLIGWDSIGNSNWYIFDIILCYAIVWVAFTITSIQGKQNTPRAIFFTIILFLTSLVILALTKPEHWYNTILCFVTGMLFSQFKGRILPVSQKHYCLLLALMTILFVIFHVLPDGIFSILYNLESISFALCIVLFSMKIKIQNKVLLWLGKHLFPLYIYQRLAMIILYEMDGGIFIRNYPIVYMTTSITITIFIAILFHYWQISFTPKQK